MVVVKFKREDSVNGHRLCWEAAAAALQDLVRIGTFGTKRAHQPR